MLVVVTGVLKAVSPWLPVPVIVYVDPDVIGYVLVDPVVIVDGSVVITIGVAMLRFLFL